MKLYRVTQIIDVEAETPREAAHRVRLMQMSQLSAHEVFQVVDLDGDARQTYLVDLMEEPLKP